MARRFFFIFHSHTHESAARNILTSRSVWELLLHTCGRPASNNTPTNSLGAKQNLMALANSHRHSEQLICAKFVFCLRSGVTPRLKTYHHSLLQTNHFAHWAFKQKLFSVLRPWAVSKIKTLTKWDKIWIGDNFCFVVLVCKMSFTCAMPSHRLCYSKQNKAFGCNLFLQCMWETINFCYLSMILKKGF